MRKKKYINHEKNDMTDGWTDSNTEVQMDGQPGERMDRQTDRS